MSQTYPGLILGFIQVGMKYCAVIQSSNDPMSMEKLTQDFICKFKLPSNTLTSVVEIESISNPYVSSRIMVDPKQNIIVHYLKGNGLNILVIE
jgi:hypothetical protein